MLFRSPSILVARTRACLQLAQIRPLVIAFLFFLSLLPKLPSFWGLLYNPNPIFSICLSLQSSTAAVSSPLSLSSHSLPPHLSLSVIVSCLRFSLSPSRRYFSLYHTASVHFFAGMLLRYSFCFFFFLVLCLLLCLVLDVWVVRKCGKAKGFSRFVNFFWVC